MEGLSFSEENGGGVDWGKRGGGTGVGRSAKSGNFGQDVMYREELKK